MEFVLEGIKEKTMNEFYFWFCSEKYLN